MTYLLPFGEKNHSLLLETLGMWQLWEYFYTVPSDGHSCDPFLEAAFATKYTVREKKGSLLLAGGRVI